MNAMQLNIDGFMVQAVPLFVLYLLTDVHYSFSDTGIAIVISFLSLSGNIAITKALETGKGGPIMAIDNLKSLVALFMDLALQGMAPTLLQSAGVVLSIAGGVVVGFAK